MRELIKISTEVIGAEEVNSVDARELHVELEIKKHFSQWIEAQIQRAGLQENIDFVIVYEKVKAGAGSVTRKEYIIKTDSAKHIAMMSQGSKASAVRDYFIAVEKEFKASSFCTFPKELQEFMKATTQVLLEQSKAIAELAKAINTNCDFTRTLGFDISTNAYCLKEMLEEKNLGDTLSSTQLDDIKKAINKRAKELSLKHAIDEADTRRLLFGKLNSRFSVETYYKIYYIDFHDAIYYIKNVNLKTFVINR